LRVVWSDLHGRGRTAVPRRDESSPGGDHRRLTSDVARHDGDDTWVRRLGVETIGTFLLVFVSAGVGMVAYLHPDQVSTGARIVAPALALTALIFAFGGASGAHFNPAVTLAFAVRSVFPWRWLPGYVLAQMVGAVAAAGVLAVMLPGAIDHGVTSPTGSVAQAFWFELVLMALRVVVVLNTASEHRLLGSDAALASGATLAAGGFIGIAISGASMNPARSLGPAIVAGVSDHQWLYVVAPCIGAVIAVGVMVICHGAVERAERDAAQGDGKVDG
jgi:MIP family channel proteins